MQLSWIRNLMLFGGLIGMLPDTLAAADRSPSEKLVTAAQVKELFRARCFECHGGSRTAADVRILDRELLVSSEKIVPGKPGESLLLDLISADDDSVMPPEGQPKLSEAEIQRVRLWIEEGSLPFPADQAIPTSEAQDPAGRQQGVPYILSAIAAHVRDQPREKRPFLRYFSTHHLVGSGVTPAELDLQREALAKAINHLSWERTLVPLESIEETRTVFAVDIRKLGWHQRPFQRLKDDQPAGVADVNLFDLALLEYPYATVYEDSPAYEELVESYMVPARLIRPIPYVRADWFASAMTLPLLYEDFLQLPFELAELETKLGVDSGANVRDGLAPRAGMTVSGVSRNNRVVERHASTFGAYWKSFDYASNKGTENMFSDPINLHPVGGEMVFTLPNGLNGYFVTDAVGRRIEAAPTSIVTDKFAEDKTVRNGLSCIRCHDQGIKSFSDTVRDAVVKLPGSPGFDKQHTLQLYIPKKEMDAHVRQDVSRFLRAMEDLLGKPQVRDPLTPVSQRFLDHPLSLTTVTGELGLKSAESLRAAFELPGFSSLGMIPLLSQGVIRRDMWEDYYDQIVRRLGLGIPIVPLDGLGRPGYAPGDSKLKVLIKTNRPHNVFSPGDEMFLTVTNESQGKVFVELIGTSALGRKVILVPATTEIAPGNSFRFPSQGAITIQPTVGKEQITLFASTAAFPAGEVLRGKNVIDRVVHNLYSFERKDARNRIGFDPVNVIKQTIEIETR